MKQKHRAESNYIGMYELLDAVEATIKAATPLQRASLAATFDAYFDNNLYDFLWAIGPQSPTLLHELMMVIEAGCRSPDDKTSAMSDEVHGNA